MPAHRIVAGKLLAVTSLALPLYVGGIAAIWLWLWLEARDRYGYPSYSIYSHVGEPYCDAGLLMPQLPWLPLWLLVLWALLLWALYAMPSLLDVSFDPDPLEINLPLVALDGPLGTCGIPVELVIGYAEPLGRGRRCGGGCGATRWPGASSILAPTAARPGRGVWTAHPRGRPSVSGTVRTLRRSSAAFTEAARGASRRSTVPAPAPALR